jgi:2-C-methyl-D-erythritol 2,4-cyclodiphosphate synthase
MKIKTGIGIDVHRLAAGKEFWLGGIQIEHEKGCVAHSDGDALVHAICDALLGAAGIEDIGHHFPDDDPAYAGIDSKKLLRRVGEMVSDRGYAIANIDSVVCLQRPRIGDRVRDMRDTLAATLGIPAGDVSVKCTTTEHLGFEGREEGVSAYATVLLTRF